ncbi:MAG: type III-A CRISPR-associated protein Cas10/Csm1, partial [Sphaerospermopsis kisseleviana]
IYAGGGNLYILAGDISKVNNTINYVHENINKWLMNSFQGKLFLALDWLSVNPNCLNKKEFAEDWVRINKKLAIQKNQKFKEQIQTGNLLKIRTSYEPCRVCHRDDLPKLKPLKNTDSSPACWLCINMFDLGDKLFKIKAIVRSSKSVLNKTLDKVYRLYIAGKYYFLFESLDDILYIDNVENIFLINNWELQQYQRKNTILLLLGNYGQITNKTDESAGYIRSSEMA